MEPPTAPGSSPTRRPYGVQNITDGTSNTIAFWRGADPRRYVCSPPYRGGIAAKIYSQNQGGLFDARTNIPQVMSDLQTVHAVFPGEQNPVGANDKGFRWAIGGHGLTSFNTIVPPNSQQYPWGGCRLDQSGGGFALGQYSNATSNHPGGCNFLFGRRSVKFVKNSINIKT